MSNDKESSFILTPCWLGSSLSYISPLPDSNFLLNHGDCLAEEDIIQMEIAKISRIKSRILQQIIKGSETLETDIEGLRSDLKVFHKALPEWIRLASLLDPARSTPLRRIILYLHLFYLSAMQLLHRKIMTRQADVNSLHRENARGAVREGLMAAKMSAKILALIGKEGSMVQSCWLCM
jgi:hypothetical protein